MAMLAGMQEILINFDEKALDKLRTQFEDLGLSLDFAQFVTCMGKMLPEMYERDKVQFVADIRELFDEIDVNGDGDLEWGEFTAYCANLGFVATKHKTIQTETRKYIPDDYPLDSRWFKGPCIEQLLFIEEHKMLVVVESLATSLKFFDTRFRPTHSFQPPAALRSIRGREGNNISIHIGAPAITHICYAPVMEAICISTNDNWLSLYHVTELNVIVKVQSALPISYSCWCSHEEQMILTVAGDDNHLECWDIKSKKQVPVDNYSHKTEVGITAILDIPAHALMITSGNRLSLWATTMDRVNHRGHLKRTRRQVERMVYSDAHDILLTTSTDRDCIGWDLATRAPMLYLKGHRYSLADVRLAPFGPHQNAITVDRHGVVKVWNINRTVSGFATCLQSIDTRCSATCLGVVTPKCDVVLGADKLRVLRCQTEKVELAAPTCAIYNPLFATVLVAMGDAVRIYDAHTGMQTDFFPNLCKADISAVCLDDRKRKFCLGTTNGEILVCSYQDGVPLKSVADPVQKHTREIGTLLYNEEDKCLLSTAWDRRLCVWDENPREEVEMLRMTHNAHQADILCMVHSRRLSLIATGSVDLLVHVFDFEFCKQLAVLEGHPSEVTCMSFVDPYALLVSGDASGMLIFWQLRPLRWAKIAVLRNDQEVPLCTPDPVTLGVPVGPPATKKPEAKVGATGVVVMDLLKRGGGSNVHLYTGDEKGILRCWDISVLLSELVVPAEKRLLANKSSYNPHRRLQHSGEENTDLVHVGKLYNLVRKASKKVLSVKLDSITSPDTISVSTRAKRFKRGNPTVRLKPIRAAAVSTVGPRKTKPTRAAPVSATGPRTAKRNLIAHLPKVVPLRPATALESKRFKLLHKWKAHYDTIKSLQVVEDSSVLVTASVDMSVCFWKLDGTRTGLIDLNRSFVKRKNRDWHFEVDWTHMIEQKRAYAKEFLAKEKRRKQKLKRDLEWQKELEAHEKHVAMTMSMPALPVVSKAPVSRTSKERTLVRRSASSEEGLAQTLLRKGLEVTNKRKTMLASLGPRRIKPSSAQRRRASIRTSILSQLRKTATWQSEHSVEEVVVKKDTPPPPPGSRAGRYTMPSLESLKAKYHL